MKGLFLVAEKRLNWLTFFVENTKYQDVFFQQK